jgi:hypothetical protein
MTIQRPPPKLPVVTLGVCAMDVKARSKAMREILTRLVEIENGGVEVKIFGDVVILEEGELKGKQHEMQCLRIYDAVTMCARAFNKVTTALSVTLNCEIP